MNDVAFWFKGWEALVRILVIGTTGYATLLALLRVSGQRTLARMTPFDFIITVTIGSAFGRVLTAKEVALAEVVVTFALLVALQWLVVAVRYRLPGFGRIVTADPSLLFHDGRYVRDAMRRHRLTEHDVLTVARQEGLGSLDQAKAIILEPDGEFSVITPGQLGDGSALRKLSET
jgi:uncharacterized membrane protein YcaP (DUF421 family)